MTQRHTPSRDGPRLGLQSEVAVLITSVVGLLTRGTDGLAEDATPPHRDWNFEHVLLHYLSSLSQPCSASWSSTSLLTAFTASFTTPQLLTSSSQFSRASCSSKTLHSTSPPAQPLTSYPLTLPPHSISLHPHSPHMIPGPLKTLTGFTQHSQPPPCTASHLYSLLTAPHSVK